MANFQQELSGAFLRLSAKRESFRSLNQRAASLEKTINFNNNEMERLTELINANSESSENNPEKSEAAKYFEKLSEQTEMLEMEFKEIWGHLYPLQIQLVKESFSEVSKLDNLLVPLVGMMRSELELPFDQAYYAQILDAVMKNKKITWLRSSMILIKRLRKNKKLRYNYIYAISAIINIWFCFILNKY